MIRGQHGNIAPPFLPPARRGHGTSMHTDGVQTRTWADCGFYLCAIGMNGTKMFWMQAGPQTNPRVPHRGDDRFEKYGSVYPFEDLPETRVRLAYFGQILLPCADLESAASFKISCPEMLPLKISSLARTCE